MVQKFLEFVLLKEQIQTKFALLEKRVNFLFDVQLKRSPYEDKLSCWVELEGINEDDIGRAKDYILAVCSPCSVSSLEEAVLNENNNSSDRALTKQPPSVVEINNYECDRDAVTQQDTTRSETSAPQKANLGVASSELISPCGNLATRSTVSDNKQECAYTANAKSVPSKDEKTQQKVDEMVARNERNVGTNQRKTPEIGEKGKVREVDEKISETCSVSPSTDESLRDFALKLRYSESTISQALSKLGPSADKNSLLAELLKAQSSVKQLEEGSSTFAYEKPHPAPEDSNCLRPIVIDGSNVAMSHGTQRVFSCRGIGIAVDWFLQRNHRNIKVFVPMWRAKSSRPESPIADQEVLKRLQQDGILVWTPSRQSGNGRIIKCYDDRYIIKHAAETDGVIVSNDNFRDLMAESHEWKKVIEQRLLMYTFVDDKFMPPDDPLGRHGPTLDEFLKKGCGKLCPYERNCTYGNRCKYLHPERNPIKTEADSFTPCSEHLPPEVPYGQVSRPSRPLPPCPPEGRQHTTPLPPAPSEYHKPLPLPPQGEFPAQMKRVFPPTLRPEVVGIGQRRSDPLPLPSDVQWLQEQFERTLSDPCFQEQACGGVPRGPMVRRGSVPHVQYHTPPYSSAPPEILMRSSMTVPRMPNDSSMVNGDWMLQPDQTMYRRPGYQNFPPRYPSNPPVSGQSSVYEGHQPLPPNHWRIPAFPQQQPQYTPAHQQHYGQYGPADQYAPGAFQPGYGRMPYNGQRNCYYRSRAPPIIDGWCGDVTDNPKEGDLSLDHEKLRIEAYEKLCEVFPDDVEKVLAVLDKYSDETSVETLTEHMLDDIDN